MRKLYARQTEIAAQSCGPPGTPGLGCSVPPARVRLRHQANARRPFWRLVVDGSETLFPILKGLPERFFLIKHAEPGGAVGVVISVNGQLNPVVDIRPGDM
jgi:hypothetical protein